MSPSDRSKGEYRGAQHEGTSVNERPSLAGKVDAIVVGASAGGVDALSVLLPALPRDLQAPVFVVLHLPRDRPSLLVEIFQPKCTLPVREAEDKEPVEAGTLYFAPPDYHLLVDAGPHLALSADEPVHYSRPSIDVLFESAADRYGARLLGIVLTGANEDGAAGAAAVQRAGGITLVQQPESAQVPLMPASALKRAAPTHVLTLAAMAALLRTLAADGRDTSPRHSAGRPRSERR
jgi:two-component system, chemotaxis family, protein-glutamate methylesterase/glutaminase